MKIDFQPAFAVDIKHDYYPDGISADFMLAPTPDCQQQLRRFGLLFKETAGGFIVLYETTGTDGPVEPKRRIEAPLAFSFVLWAKSPYLLNYSNLPLSKTPEQIFYLSNRHQVLNNAQLLLSADPVGEFVSAADLLPLRPQRFRTTLFTSFSRCAQHCYHNDSTPTKAAPAFLRRSLPLTTTKGQTAWPIGD